MGGCFFCLTNHKQAITKKEGTVYHNHNILLIFYSNKKKNRTHGGECPAKPSSVANNSLKMSNFTLFLFICVCTLTHFSKHSGIRFEREFNSVMTHHLPAYLACFCRARAYNFLSLNHQATSGHAAQAVGPQVVPVCVSYACRL